METLRIQRQAMKEKNLQLSKQIDSLTLDLEELRLTVADDARKLGLLRTECDEWRRKYKEEVKVRFRIVFQVEKTKASDRL